MAADPKRTAGRLARLSRRLFPAEQRVVTVTERRQAALMSYALLFMLAVFTVLTVRDMLTIDSYHIPPSEIVGYAMLLVAYGFSRRRRAKLGALVLVAMFPMVLFPEVITGHVVNPATTLCLLVPGLIIATIFLSVMETALVAALYIVGLLLVPVLGPEIVPSLVSISTSLAVVVISAVLAVGAMHLRNLSESDRRAELSESENRFRTLTSSAPVGIAQTDGEGICTFVNPCCVEMMGSSEAELCAHGWESELHPDNRAKVTKRWKTAVGQNQPFAEECRFLRADGAELFVQVAAVPRSDREGAGGGYFVTFSDLTQRVRLEEQLRQAQKMEAIGRLAGGLAHDFNNLLTAILGSASLARARAARDDAPLLESLSVICEAAAAASSLTGQLLLFARKQISQPHVVDLGELVKGMRRLLARVLGENIEVKHLVGDDEISVLGDHSQFEQVVLNLAVNARDAMPDGGTLTLELAVVTLGEADADSWPDAKPGSYALLRVTDSGEGMSQEVRSHVFEPFFSTKSADKGTGLGLSVCHGIVAQSGGHIRVMSRPGEGATFEVFLPVADVAASAAASTPPRAQPVAGRELVLVVEDQELVRNVAVKSLRALDYRVLSADGGESALALLSTIDSPPEAIVTDVVMPKMSGFEVVERVRAVHPEIKVLYCSGYTGDPETLRKIEANGGAFLPKPYTPTSLAAKLREVLDGDG